MSNFSAIPRSDKLGAMLTLLENSLLLGNSKVWWPLQPGKAFLYLGGSGGMSRKLDQYSSYIHKLNILKLSSSYNSFPPFPCTLEVRKERI